MHIHYSTLRMQQKNANATKLSTKLYFSQVLKSSRTLNKMSNFASKLKSTETFLYHAQYNSVRQCSIVIISSFDHVVSLRDRNVFVEVSSGAPQQPHFKPWDQGLTDYTGVETFTMEPKYAKLLQGTNVKSRLVATSRSLVFFQMFELAVYWVFCCGVTCKWVFFC